jgi:hypothetical protein
MNRWSPYFLSVLRVIAAFVYGVHGAQRTCNCQAHLFEVAGFHSFRWSFLDVQEYQDPFQFQTARHA